MRWGWNCSLDGALPETHADAKLARFCMLKRQIFASEFGIWKSDAGTKFFCLLDKSWGVRRWNYVTLTILTQWKKKGGEAFLLGRVCHVSRCQFFNSAYLPDLCRNPRFLNNRDYLSAHWAPFGECSGPALSIAFVPGCIVSTCGSCIWHFALSVGPSFLCLPWCWFLLKEFHI